MQTDLVEADTRIKIGDVLLQLEAVSKQFPGVLALNEVDFELRAGEVHVLFGENGAGKSTMASIIAGVYRPTAGQILFKGQKQVLHSVHDARLLGISAVFQEFSLVPQLTVSQNLSLGEEATRYGFLDKRTMRRQANEILQQLGFSLAVDRRIAHLSRAEQQMVEIAGAFRSDLSVLILDEPTASLTEKETASLFRLINQAKADGVGIIYITHRMAEIKQIADRVTVLRDGKYVATVNAGTVSEDELLQHMTGRVIDQVFPQISYTIGETMLQVENLVSKSGYLEELSFYVRSGEIVGFAGLVGCGKSRAARSCFGIEPISAGKITFNSEDTTGRVPRFMLDKGMFYIPPDRRTEGLVMMRSVRENISLPSLGLPKYSGPLFLKRSTEKRVTRGLAERLNLQPLALERAVNYFSGGNQQKVLLARTLTRDVKLFIFDEPTVGVDVGTRVAIYKFMADLCEAGAAILLVSSDLPEILHLTNRAYVFHRGKLRAELHNSQITEENVLSCFFDEQNIQGQQV